MKTQAGYVVIHKGKMYVDLVSRSARGAMVKALELHKDVIVKNTAIDHEVEAVFKELLGDFGYEVVPIDINAVTGEKAE